MDKIFAHVSKAFPDVGAEAQCAEWWVHSRAHSSGHQLHFDSDETGIENGQTIKGINIYIYDVFVPTCLLDKPHNPLLTDICFYVSMSCHVFFQQKGSRTTPSPRVSSTSVPG